MKIVTRQEFIDWIRSNHGNKKINMSENKAGDPCGCLMVQYARDKFPKDFFKKGSCGYESWTNQGRTIAKLDCDICEIVPGWKWANIKTFQQVKKILTETR